MSCIFNVFICSIFLPIFTIKFKGPRDQTPQGHLGTPGASRLYQSIASISEYRVYIRVSRRYKSIASISEYRVDIRVSSSPFSHLLSLQSSTFPSVNSVPFRIHFGVLLKKSSFPFSHPLSLQKAPFPTFSFFNIFHIFSFIFHKFSYIFSYFSIFFTHFYH